MIDPDGGLDGQAAAIADVAARLRAAHGVTVLTGAGVSAASGVPTFRGAGGLWRTSRPEDLATPAAFARDPRLVWEWYDWRRQLLAACRPNAAHDVLARWQRRWPALTLVTQNVDDLHERAGSTGVLHLHGSIWSVRCRRGCAGGRTRRRCDDVPLRTLPPICPHCGDVDRPGVVWFGEALDDATLHQAAEAAAGCDVFIAVGTSAQVHPAAGLIPHARRSGAFVVEINPDATPYSADVDAALTAPAEVLLPRLDAALSGA
jgi:NAD-dependent deacetylase